MSQTQRQRLDTRINEHAYQQITFVDRDGKSKMIRLKLGVEEIYQDKQIKEHGIDANAKFTQKERDALRFSHGSLTTASETVQRFLETSPQFEDNWMPEKDPAGQGRVYTSDDIARPLYKLLDTRTEIVNENKAFKDRLKAANKIADMGLKEGQDLLIRLNGSFFIPPTNIEEVQNALVDILDSSDDMISEILRDRLTPDEEVLILINRAIQAKILDFDKVPNQVVKIKGKQTIPLREISSDLAPEERTRYFAEYLVSEKGKLLYADLQKELQPKGEPATVE